MAPNEYWGPDERLALLSELFGIDMDATRRLAIEPPFYCDYGTNIKSLSLSPFCLYSLMLKKRTAAL